MNDDSLDFDPATEKHARFIVSTPKSWDDEAITAPFIWSDDAWTTTDAETDA